MSEEEVELLPIGRAAAMIGVHQNTLRRWSNAKLVPFTLLPSGQRRYSREQVQQIRAQMLTHRLPGIDEQGKRAA